MKDTTTAFKKFPSNWEEEIPKDNTAPCYQVTLNMGG